MKQSQTEPQIRSILIVEYNKALLQLKGEWLKVIDSNYSQNYELLNSKDRYYEIKH